MVQAQIIEKYIKSNRENKRQGIETVIHETRYFSTKKKFHEWYDTFKEQLWEDDKSKVDLAEGIYVTMELVKDSKGNPVDDMNPPRRLSLYASFRPNISYRYAS